MADVVSRFINEFPKGQVFSQEGIYYARCTATPPSVGFQIGDKTFWFDPQDLILTFMKEGNLCPLGIQGGPEPWVLGQNFLTNVLAVFDVGAREMRFAQRVPY